MKLFLVAWAAYSLGWFILFCWTGLVAWWAPLLLGPVAGLGHAVLDWR